jgi:hypothetical protein
MSDTTAYFEDAYPDEECGCPVEEWTVCGITMQIHFEPDGSLEVYADTGDWDMNVPLKAATLSEGRAEAFAWARGFWGATND